MKPQYVYTVECDIPINENETVDSGARAIVWEQYLDQGAADLERVAARVTSIGGRFGRVRIARLAYIDEDADLSDALDRIANLHDFEMTTVELANAMYDARCIALSALAKLKETK